MKKKSGFARPGLYRCRAGLARCTALRWAEAPRRPAAGASLQGCCHAAAG